ncbi:MAG: glycosyl transferase family 2 [Bacteroidetes bacterium CG23_combo_of_CG06-09_8_20_14_all_32_9]|nr:MAG: glycosyl transferase family 2 [Bacteroidetes bacterium CG23_combo_of_CG06-09_8_20_14_all_32_9]
MISLDNITLSFGGFNLFRGISFFISQKDRIGLVGRNGAGKSTLLKLIIGEVKPDEGIISKPSELTIGYLPQLINYKDSTTVWEETISAFKEVNSIQKRINKINIELTELNQNSSDKSLKLVTELSDLNEHLIYIDGGNIDEKTERVLIGLGFKRSDFLRLTNEFSIGWRMRIELAKILLQTPQVFLLDEPTNHLDIEAIQWLEDFLKDYNGIVLIISHDKAFLDNVTQRTIEISLGKIYDYKVPYSKFVALRDERHQQQLSAFKNQQKMIKNTEKFIERFRYKATKSVQVQSRIKQLSKIERMEVDKEDISSMNIAFQPSPRSGSVVYEFKKVYKSYGENEILNNIDFIIQRGDKLALIGRNGEGKTTLIRMINGELEYCGTGTCGYKVKIGYYAQNQDQTLDKEKTVLQSIDDIATGEVRTKIRQILGAFLFSGEDVDKKVKVLSGGECSRLALAKLLLEPVNFLLLDEPTNHLDIISKEVLKKALQKYDGTLLIVSHDRDFLDGLVTRIVEVRNKKLKEYSNNIWDFLAKKKIETLHELNRNKVQVKLAKPVSVKINNKQRFAEKKEFDKLLRKAENKITLCEKQISELELEIKKMDEILMNPEEFKRVAYDSEVFEKYNSIKINLEKKINEWEVLHKELTKLQ